MLRDKMIFLKGVVVGLILFIISFANVQNKMLKKVCYERNISSQKNIRYQVINLWLMLKQQGKSLEDYFKYHSYFDVAIYGMGEMGERLVDELSNTDIYIKYGIDNNAKNIFSTVKVCLPDEILGKVDVVVVTALNDFNIVKKNLSEIMDCPIVSLKDIIDDVL